MPTSTSLWNRMTIKRDRATKEKPLNGELKNLSFKGFKV
jgi:hypothetical protein